MTDPASLPDRLDDALAALWAGRSDALDQLVGGESADSPAFGRVIGATLVAAQEDNPPPREIGGFEILGELGRGGMGVVYRARRADLERQVALKVIRRSDLHDSSRIRLFQREMQTLARLRHPNIASLYDAGKTPEDQHFFVMELGEGSTLSVFASSFQSVTRPAKETTASLISVFCKVCDAIAHAHQKGVIHRDIKPSNILVAPNSDASGRRMGETFEVKVLDFGLARIIDPEAVTRSVTIDDSRLKGTLPYMSPEQLVAGDEDVDIRADVYSLGVVLYQLLAGRLPIDPKKRSMTEMLSAIREESVPRPSSIIPHLRGDLETIILKAIDRDPAHRYQSADALGDDLRRFLANEPIQARPPSFAYLARKLVGRHKLAFALCAVLLVVSLAAGAISVASLSQARAAKAAADKERVIAESVGSFLQDTFSHIDPRLARNRDTVLLRELLAQAVRRADVELGDAPEVRARLLGAFGNVYLSLGALDDAEKHLVAALEINERTLGSEHPETLTAKNNLATLRSDQGCLGEAARLGEETLAARRKILGQEHVHTALSLNNVGDLYRELGRLPEAEKLLEEALELRRRLLGHQHPDTLVTMNNLAGVWVLQRKMKKAEEMLRECLAGQVQTLSNDHPDVLATKSDLSLTLDRSGPSPEAETLLQEVIEGYTRQYGPGHMDTLITRYNLCSRQRSRQSKDEAAASMGALLVDADAHLPAGHQLIGSFRSAYARRMLEAGQWSEALAPAIQSQRELEESLGRSHPSTRAAIDTIADIYEALGQSDKAAEYRKQGEQP